MGYVKLGQPATTLSGGEAQRCLHQNFIDPIRVEPFTFLMSLRQKHMSDVARLIQVLNRLVDSGNSVIVVEHDMDFIQ